MKFVAFSIREFNFFGFMKMRLIVVVTVVTGLFINSCGNATKNNEMNTRTDDIKIHQATDGTISLNVEKADCYSDMNDPSGNTAEWRVRVSKSGRYNVWISSATKDTTDLKYKNAVLVSVQDNRIEARPACDKIIQDSKDVNYPFFRADSYLGSMYIQDTGLFNVQVISEKILPKDYNAEAEAENAKLLSVSFTPITR